MCVSVCLCVCVNVAPLITAHPAGRILMVNGVASNRRPVFMASKNFQLRRS